MSQEVDAQKINKVSNNLKKSLKVLNKELKRFIESQNNGNGLCNGEEKKHDFKSEQ